MIFNANKLEIQTAHFLSVVIRVKHNMTSAPLPLHLLHLPQKLYQIW